MSPGGIGLLCEHSKVIFYTHSPIIYQPKYFGLELVFTMDLSRSSLSGIKKFLLGNGFSGAFGRQLIFLSMNVLESVPIGL
jgi:hypothetical protein